MSGRETMETPAGLVKYVGQDTAPGIIAIEYIERDLGEVFFGPPKPLPDDRFNRPQNDYGPVDSGWVYLLQHHRHECEVRDVTGRRDDLTAEGEEDYHVGTVYIIPDFVIVEHHEWAGYENLSPGQGFVYNWAKLEALAFA